MKSLDSLQMATRTLLAHKTRSALTMLGIIIGNASVIAMIGIGQGTQRFATDQFKGLSPTTLFVLPGSRRERNNTLDLPKTLVIEDARAIAQQVPTVTHVAPEINRRLIVTYRNRDAGTQVIGTNPEYQVVRSFAVAEGRFFNELDVERSRRVAVVGTDVVTRLFAYQKPIGQTIRIQNIPFEVIGIMESKGSSLGTNQDDSILIPWSTMAYQIVGKTSPYGVQVSWIGVTAKDEESVRAAKFQIQNLLRLRHKIVNEDDFGVETPKQIMEILESITSGLTIMLAGIAGISLVVGGIGVMNIMLVSVSERTQEIGLRKAVGAREEDILIQFLIEAIIVSAVGGLIGIVLGSGLVYLIGVFSPLSTSVSGVGVILALAVSGGIGLFFGVYPAQRAAKLDPIVALRSI